MCPLQTRNLYLALIGIGIFPFFVNGYVNSIIYQIPLAYWLFELFCWALLPTLVLGIASKKGGLRFSEIGLHSKLFGKGNLVLLVFLSIIFGPIEFWVYTSLYDFFWPLFKHQGVFQYHSVLPQSGWPRILVAAYFAISAGVIEEIFFRGWMYRVAGYFLRPRVVYLMVSPLLFALVHWESGAANVLATFILGLMTALVFIALRNLWPLIAGHVYTDFFLAG